MSLGNAIGALAGVVFSIIGVSVLFKDVRVQDYPKMWKEDYKNRYIPELMRPKEVQADETNQHPIQHSKS